MEHSDLNGMSSSKPASQGSRIYEEETERLQEPDVVGDSKETLSSRLNRIDTHVNSEAEAAQTGLHRFQPDKNPSTEKRNGRKGPRLTQTLCQLKPCGKGKVFLSGVSVGISPTL